MLKWNPAVVDGTSYDLSHLHPMTFPLAMAAKGALPAQNFTINVAFGLHCFTAEKTPDTPEALDYGDAREIRSFDLGRYELSKSLPEIIQSLPQRRCYEAKLNNYMTVEMTGDQGLVHYQVYFKVTKTGAPNTLRLFVQSAYAKNTPKQVQRQKPCLFKAICAKASL